MKNIFDIALCQVFRNTQPEIQNIRPGVIKTFVLAGCFEIPGREFP